MWLRVVALSVAALLTLLACDDGEDAAQPLPFELADYQPLVAQLEQALADGDASLLREVVRSRYGDVELWIGGWGGCGAGVRVAPLVDENIEALFEGSSIRVTAIARNDACEGQNLAYGVLTTGWLGKVFPYTYSGEAGPSSGILPWSFDQDTALLVFWSPSILLSQPAFFGLAPGGAFEEIAPLPR